MEDKNDLKWQGGFVDTEGFMPVVEQETKEVMEEVFQARAFELDSSMSKVIDAIQNTIAEYIRPAIEEHGGSIELRGYKDGIVYVKLAGACDDCPSAGETVEYGIKAILKMCIPEVIEVISEV